MKLIKIILAICFIAVVIHFMGCLLNVFVFHKIAVAIRNNTGWWMLTIPIINMGTVCSCAIVTLIMVILLKFSIKQFLLGAMLKIFYDLFNQFWHMIFINFNEPDTFSSKVLVSLIIHSILTVALVIPTIYIFFKLGGRLDKVRSPHK